MHLSLLLTEQIGSMFIMLLFGFLMVRLKLLNTEDSKKFSTLILYVITPCTLFSAFQITYTKEKLTGLGIAFLAAAIVHILYIVLTMLFHKVFHFKQIEQASLVYTNGGNLIIPLVSAVLGKEWVIFSCAYITVLNILFWSHGKSIISGVKGIDFKKILFNINIISIILGAFVFVTGLPIPPFLQTAIENTGSMVGPSCMIVTGMLIGNMKLKEVFWQKRPYLICFFRLVVYPFLVVLLFTVSNISHIYPDAERILIVVLLAAAAPSAATITQLAQLYDREPGYASILNVLSIFFCIITMPLMVMLYQFLV